MVFLHQNELHNSPTRRSQYSYEFTAKHHGSGNKSDARWHPSMTRGEEFSIFDDADFFELVDDKGSLYAGWWIDDGKALRTIGTCGQEIAKFWPPSDGNHWHGFPSHPLNGIASPNRRGLKESRPPKTVIQRMFVLGLIKERVRRRLSAASHL